MVYVMLAEGFEEVEALTPVDLLRRAGLEVQLVSIGDTLVTGARGITVQADLLLSEMDMAACEMLILPGGMPGTKNLYANETLCDYVKQTAADETKYLAAICAAPSVILGGLGLLSGRRATCYPGMEDGMTGATAVDTEVVRDGRIITARGVGAALAFSKELISVLCGSEKAKEIALDVVYYG